jgi:hypothetical protein
VGGVSCVSLPGLLGLGPLVTLQQLEVGPGPYDKSSLKVGKRGGLHVCVGNLCISVQLCALPSCAGSVVLLAAQTQTLNTVVLPCPLFTPPAGA